MSQVPAKMIQNTVVEFFSAAPTLEEIAEYRLPEELQIVAQALLEKNRSGTMTEAERAEMAEFRQFDHLLALIKAKAKLNLNGRAITFNR